MSATQHSIQAPIEASEASALAAEPSLRALGVYGFDELQSVVWASLASGDPLLLIGNAGTGKTFLLNSLSEALGLEHRHYNASLISFDDLVGFPFNDIGIPGWGNWGVEFTFITLTYPGMPETTSPDLFTNCGGDF